MRNLEVGWNIYSCRTAQEYLRTKWVPKVAMQEGFCFLEYHIVWFHCTMLRYIPEYGSRYYQRCVNLKTKM